MEAIRERHIESMDKIRRISAEQRSLSDLGNSADAEKLSEDLAAAKKEFEMITKEYFIGCIVHQSRNIKQTLDADDSTMN
jgi:vacuolar-type H+-ATPase subunit B/Vma2